MTWCYSQTDVARNRDRVSQFNNEDNVVLEAEFEEDGHLLQY